LNKNNEDIATPETARTWDEIKKEVQAEIVKMAAEAEFAKLTAMEIKARAKQRRSEGKALAASMKKTAQVEINLAKARQTEASVVTKTKKTLTQRFLSLTGELSALKWKKGGKGKNAKLEALSISSTPSSPLLGFMRKRLEQKDPDPFLDERGGDGEPPAAAGALRPLLSSAPPPPYYH
jgi:hypothetical protein